MPTTRLTVRLKITPMTILMIMPMTALLDPLLVDRDYVNRELLQIKNRQVSCNIFMHPVLLIAFVCHVYLAIASLRLSNRIKSRVFLYSASVVKTSNRLLILINHIQWPMFRRFPPSFTCPHHTRSIRVVAHTACVAGSWNLELRNLYRSSLWLNWHLLSL